MLKNIIILLLLFVTTLLADTKASMENKILQSASVDLANNLWKLDEKAIQEGIEFNLNRYENLVAIQVVDIATNYKYNAWKEDNKVYFKHNIDFPTTISLINKKRLVKKLIHKDKVFADLIIYLENKELDELLINSDEIFLTAQEKDFLLAKKDIKMCVIPDYLPFGKIDNNNNYIGIAADIIHIIENKISTQINLLPTKSWAESLDNIKKRRCDILSFAINAPSRVGYLNFTKPHIVQPLVITTTIDKFFIKDASELLNKKIGIVKNFAFTEVVKLKYPTMNIIEVENIEDGLRRVSNGELFGYLDSLPSVGYFIQKNAYVDLKIAGKIEIDMQVGIASRNDEPLLNDILQKALDTISDETKQKLYNKWILVKLVENTNVYDILKWIVITLFVTGIIIYLILKKNREQKEEISYRKSIETELENTLELFNMGETTLFKWANDGILSVLYVSQNSYKNLGYKSDLFVNEKKQYLSLIHEEDINRVHLELESKAHIDLIEHKPYRIKKSNGEYIWVMDKTKIIRDEKNNIQYYLAYIRNITKEIEQKQELVNSHNNLIKSEKLAALGQLLANIAHEINSPLGAINSSAESISNELSYFVLNYSVLLKKLNNNHEDIFMEIVNKIVNHNEFIASSQERVIKKEIKIVLDNYEIENSRIVADKLTRIKLHKIEDIESIIPLLNLDIKEDILNILLIISKLFSSNRNIKEAIKSSTKTILALKTYSHSMDDTTSISMKTIKESMDTVLTIYNNKLKYNVVLEYNVENLEPIEANHDELMQVWTNIIHNALYAMNNKGILKINIFQKGIYQIVEFIDSGSGMDKETKSKIFEPFFTTKPQGVGSGLGLDIIQNIIHKHKGEIEVESEVGKGSTFRIFLLNKKGKL